MIAFPAAILAMQDESDRAFMERLYQDYGQLMFHVAYQALCSEHDAQDAVNTACEKMIRNLAKLRALSPDALRAYVVVTVRNTAIDHLRKRKRDCAIAYQMEDGVLEALPDEQNVELQVQRLMQKEALLKAIAALPERYAAILTYKYLDDLPDEQIARLLGVKPISLRALLHRARTRLAAQLQEVMDLG